MCRTGRRCLGRACGDGNGRRSRRALGLALNLAIVLLADSVHGVMDELRLGHGLVMFGDVKVGIEEEQGVARAVDIA